MATEIYNNLHPKKASHIDERLITVADVGSLPDPNTDSLFIYEGAIVYVTDVKLNYQAQEDGITAGNLVWVNVGGAATDTKVQGVINLLPTATTFDCANVSPDISTCHSVLINIAGGSTVNISSISNLPVADDEDDLITFYVETGKTVTFVHTDYDAATTDTIVLEDGFDMTLTGRLIGNESLTLKRQDSANTQWDAVQYIKKGDLVTSFTSAFGVINDLTSTSTTNALSAYQGKLLDDKITLKQDALTAGDHISISGISPNVTIDSLKWEWEKLTPSFSRSDVPETFLPATYGTLSDKYRWVDMGVDKGTWVLPPNVDPTNINNWFEFDRPNIDIETAKYLFVADATFTAVGTNYNPRISTIADTGGISSIGWNADGPATEKVCFNLPEGTYKIKAKLNVESDRHNDLQFNLYNINGLTTAATGVPGTNTLKDLALVASPTTGWTDSDGASYVVETLLDVTTANVSDGIIFGLTTTSDYTGTSANTSLAGYVEIIKLS